MEQVQKAIAQLRNDINRLKDGIVSVEKLIAEKEQTIEELSKLLTVGDANEQK